jgi:hypothetical protein
MRGMNIYLKKKCTHPKVKRARMNTGALEPRSSFAKEIQKIIRRKNSVEKKVASFQFKIRHFLKEHLIKNPVELKKNAARR